jgi:hypothetical protein
LSGSRRSLRVAAAIAAAALGATGVTACFDFDAVSREFRLQEAGEVGPEAGAGSDGCAADTLSDPANCGACGLACDQGQACNRGYCHETSCGLDEDTLVLPLQGIADDDSRARVVPSSTNAVAALGEPGHGDGDGSYVAGADPTESVKLELEHAPSTLGADREIRRIVVRARMRRTEEEPPAGSGLSLGFGFSQGHKSSSFVAGTTAYQIQSYPQTQHPVDLRPWTLADVDAFVVRMNLRALSATNEVRVTQAWVEVCHIAGQ